jgi:hypothetical protein
MAESKIKQLELLFEKAKYDNKDIALELTVPTREATEIIIVKNANLDYKLNYYKESYNENLELKRCTEIKILKVREGNFSDII